MQVVLDPALVSPLLDMPLPSLLAIRMQVDATADLQAQLFVSDNVAQFDEAQSIRWQLQPGMHTYTIDLRTLPTLPTRLVHLRLDPVADGAGGTVTIAGIWVP
jgi:hypothetical protein